MTTTQLKGNVELCESDSTVLTIKKPITMGYTTGPTTSSQIGYVNYAAYFNNTYNFVGGDKTYGWYTSLPAGTYVCSASFQTGTATSYTKCFWAKLQTNIITLGQDYTSFVSPITSDSSVYIKGTGNLASDTGLSSTTISLSGAYTSIAFFTNTFITGSPSAVLTESITVTRIG